MSDIVVSTTYDLVISNGGKTPDIILNNISNNLVLDALGDQITNNQVLAKRFVNSYRKISLRIDAGETNLFDNEFNIVDRNASPSSRSWLYTNVDVVNKIRKGLQWIYQDKWVLEENGVVTAYTLEDTTTDPWNATWVSTNDIYTGYTNIICAKVSVLCWGVVPISSIAAEGGTGNIEWAIV